MFCELLQQAERPAAAVVLTRFPFSSMNRFRKPVLGENLFEMRLSAETRETSPRTNAEDNMNIAGQQLMKN